VSSGATTREFLTAMHREEMLMFLKDRSDHSTEGGAADITRHLLGEARLELTALRGLQALSTLSSDGLTTAVEMSVFLWLLRSRHPGTPLAVGVCAALRRAGLPEEEWLVELDSLRADGELSLFIESVAHLAAETADHCGAQMFPAHFDGGSDLVTTRAQIVDLRTRLGLDSYIMKLGSDEHLLVMLQLDTLSLSALARVNRHFRDLTMSEAIWGERCARDLGIMARDTVARLPTPQRPSGTAGIIAEGVPPPPRQNGVGCATEPEADVEAAAATSTGTAASSSPQQQLSFRATYRRALEWSAAAMVGTALEVLDTWNTWSVARVILVLPPCRCLVWFEGWGLGNVGGAGVLDWTLWLDKRLDLPRVRALTPACQGLGPHGQAGLEVLRSVQSAALAALQEGCTFGHGHWATRHETKTRDGATVVMARSLEASAQAAAAAAAMAAQEGRCVAAPPADAAAQERRKQSLRQLRGGGGGGGGQRRQVVVSWPAVQRCSAESVLPLAYAPGATECADSRGGMAQLMRWAYMGQPLRSLDRPGLEAAAAHWRDWEEPARLVVGGKANMRCQARLILPADVAKWAAEQRLVLQARSFRDSFLSVSDQCWAYRRACGCLSSSAAGQQPPAAVRQTCGPPLPPPLCWRRMAKRRNAALGGGVSDASPPTAMAAAANARHAVIIPDSVRADLKSVLVLSPAWKPNPGSVDDRPSTWTDNVQPLPAGTTVQILEVRSGRLYFPTAGDLTLRARVRVESGAMHGP
jgi:hypothetical protein